MGKPPLGPGDVLWDQNHPVPRFFPTRAAIRGVTGRSVVRCTVGTDGVLGGCRVVSEEPVGLDFGLVAIAMARSMGIGKATKSGESTGGREMVVPFSFNLQDAGPDAARAPATPPVDQDEADKLIDSTEQVTWKRLPSPKEFASYFPIKARDNGVSGLALIVSKVAQNGSFEACRSVAEDPTGYGFGVAAAAMFQSKAIPNPRTKAGDAVAGRVFMTRIRFNLATR